MDAKQPIDRLHPFTFQKCDFCSYRTKLPSTLLSHINQNHQSKMKWDQFSCQSADLEDYQCEFCVFDHHLKIAVDKHNSFVHGKKDIPNAEIGLESYTCVNCHFESFSVIVFTRHICLCSKKRDKNESAYENENAKEMHSDKVKWFECEQCDYKGKTKCNVYKHFYSKHKAVKWLECDQCDFKTKSKSSLKNHVYNKHTEVTMWFRCEQCEYKAKTVRTLQKHVYNKHTEITKWFECDQCEYKTKWRNGLTRHVSNKHSEVIKWFECEHCSYISKSRGYLKKHISLKHLTQDKMTVAS